MKLFPQDNDVVVYKTGFDDDLLERKALSKQLSDLVGRIEHPIVLALDDMWGSGKTYFLKRWVAEHRNENNGSAITVYFDAFESDYVSDPLVSIITAVSERIPKEQEATLERWKAVAAKLVRPAFGIALSLATFGAKQQLDELGDIFVDAASSEAKDVARSLWDVEKQRKDAVRSFKELLVDLTEGKGAAIVIVIDELDRCRPDYALSVLEVIKHFFAVPKVHFILGVNGSALESSVRARYGDGLDAEAYLRKFINVTFSLPRDVGPRGEEAVVARYASQLILDMNLPDRVSNRCSELLAHVATQNEVSLRDVGRVFSRVALLPKEVFDRKSDDGWTDILCALLVSSVLDPKLHKKLTSASASIDEIRRFLGASEIKTIEEIDGVYNPDFNRNLMVWFVTVRYACGPELEVDEASSSMFISQIGRRFSEYGIVNNPRLIPAKIQLDWVNVFRMK